MPFLLGAIYFVLLISLGLWTIRKGHLVLFIVGFIFPFLWLVGALMPSRSRVSRHPAIHRGALLTMGEATQLTASYRCVAEASWCADSGLGEGSCAGQRAFGPRQRNHRVCLRMRD